MNQLPDKKRKKLIARILAYQSREMSLRQIAKAMGYKNHNSITHILKNYKWKN